MEHVELEAVTKRFGAFEAIGDLNLTVKKGEFCALLGPSGCGKSTLLRLIAGLEILSEGKVFINEKNVSNVAPAKRRIAMVFQSYALYPHMTVRDNIAFSLDIAGVDKAERLRRADEIARLLQLEELMDRRPANLSGGQRQRVAIGRALIRDPEVFLFDEPLSNLDAKLRVQMRLEIAKLHQDLKATMIYVTHDQVEAMTLADKVVVLDSGRISQVGAPLELYHRPANKFVASFIGSPSMNFMRVDVTAASGTTASIELANKKKMKIQTRNAVTAAPTGPFEIGIRPEHLETCAPDDSNAAVSGTVQLVEQLGSSTTVYVETRLGLLCIQTDSESAIATGDTVGISLDISHGHLFSNDGQAV